MRDSARHDYTPDVSSASAARRIQRSGIGAEFEAGRLVVGRRTVWSVGGLNLLRSGQGSDVGSEVVRSMMCSEGCIEWVSRGVIIVGLI